VGSGWAGRTYEVVELDLLLPMWVQWCVPAEPGPAPLGGPDRDDPDDADGAGEDEVEVVDTCVVAAVPEPPVAASATPVAPAPSPAATTLVMISRRVRLPVLETIGASSLLDGPPHTGGELVIWDPACERDLSWHRDRALSAL
jgi:hypothetical protein